MTVVNLREEPDAYFGGCPTCGANNGFLYMNGKNEWLVCNGHRVR